MHLQGDLTKAAPKSPPGRDTDSADATRTSFHEGGCEELEQLTDKDRVCTESAGELRLCLHTAS